MLTFNTANNTESSQIVDNSEVIIELSENESVNDEDVIYGVFALNENIIEDEVESTDTKPKTTKEIVKDYFSDIPILIDVAQCESGIVQFNKDGTVLRGVVNPQDVGVLQINEKYHLQTSIDMGIDIYTLEGNLEYARFLYNTQGTRPWEYSSHCWNKYREVALN